MVSVLRRKQILLLISCCCAALCVLQVGGVLTSPQQECEDDSSSWADYSQALCRDVHAMQPDPFNPRVLYAVAGSGQLPGGLYRCKGKGQKWKRLFGYRCASCNTWLAVDMLEHLSSATVAAFAAECLPKQGPDASCCCCLPCFL